MDSVSRLQKAHKGDSVNFNLNNFSFVNTILFNILHWNSQILVSIETVKGKEYISFQSVSSWGNFS